MKHDNRCVSVLPIHWLRGTKSLKRALVMKAASFSWTEFGKILQEVAWLTECLIAVAAYRYQ